MHGSPMNDDEEAIAQINIIPLVDVVLVLLIIFIVTTVFPKNKDSALQLNLPKGSRAEQVQQPPAEITVSVAKSGELFVNNQPTPLKELGAKIAGLQNASRKTIVVLRGDKQVLYGTIMPVLDEVSRTGVQLTLALQPAEGK